MTADPQKAIFAEGSQFYLALEYRCAPSPQLKTAIRQARAAAAASGAHAVFAFGNNLLAAITDTLPEAFSAFTPIQGASGLHAPATQRDLLIWIHGARMDANFDAARAMHNALKDHAELLLEVPGFNYHDNRDMTGFIDGTANPRDAEAHEAALVPPGRNLAGGAYVMSMQYLHDLDAFNRLSIPEQEKIIGRTRNDSTELQRAAKPNDAHIARAEITVDGEEQKIYRRSFPFGGVRQHGLYFLAFACEQRRFELILKSMYGISGDGVHDHLLHFTRAVTGSFWFAPPLGALD
ncbi:MAG: Dyp-type peroxidase [Pseudomonadota bacterium]